MSEHASDRRELLSRERDQLERQLGGRYYAITQLDRGLD